MLYKSLDSTVPHARDMSCRYLRCLASLAARFPLLDGVGNIIPSFVWHDAFHPSRFTTQRSISLERASTLFNLGAAMCQQALACDRSTPEGAMSASLIFQVLHELLRLS